MVFQDLSLFPGLSRVYMNPVTYRCLCGQVLSTSHHCYSASLIFIQRLRSSSSSNSIVQWTCHTTLDAWTLQSAASSTWNSLSEPVRCSTSLTMFCRRLNFLRILFTDFVDCPISRQVIHTYVPLSPSSITWYWSKDGDILWLGR